MPKPKPAEPGDTLPELDHTTVTLPWDAFRSLITLPKPADLEPTPPTPVVVKRARYVVEIGRRHADVTATFDVEVLKTGWTTAPLLPAEGVALKAARLDKKDLVLANLDDTYALTLEDKGSYGVELEYAVQLDDPDGGNGLHLNIISVPVSVVEVKAPGADLEVSIEPNFGIALDGGKKASRAIAAIGPATDVQIDWREKESRPTTRQVPLIASDMNLHVAVGDRVMTLNAQVTLAVQKAPIDSVCVPLPAGVTFLAAEGPQVRDWEPEGDATNRRARVRFHYEAEGELQLTLRAEKPFAPKGEERSLQLEVPVLTLAWDKAWHQARSEASQKGAAAPARTKDAPVPVERQRGVVAITAEPRTEVKLGRTQNLVPLDVKELPRGLLSSGTPLYGLRFARVPTALTLDVTQHEDLAVLVAAIDHAHVEAITLDDGRVLAKALLDVRNNSRQYLRVRLPTGSKLWSSFRANRPVKPAADAEGMLRIPLSKAGEGVPFTIELSWYLETAAFGAGGPRTLAMPQFDLPVSYYSSQVYLPRRYRHYNFEGPLKRVEVLGQSFQHRGGAGGEPPTSNVMAQAVAPAAQPTESGSAGQLPIRVPMLRRGIECRFERTLVVDETLSLAWECKRRKTDVLA